MFSFIATDPRVSAPLPVGCRTCGTIFLEGVELAPKTGAGNPKEVSLKAVEDLMKDPIADIVSYFSRVYQAGYRDAVSRSIAYFSHQRKEGRLRRIRRLWKGVTVLTNGKSESIVTMPKGTHKEISDLLRYGERHEDLSDEHKTIQPG